MSTILPIVIIVGVVLAVMAFLVWRRQKGEKLERIDNNEKKAFFAQWIIGVVLALVAAVFMFDGDILGQNTTQESGKEG